MGAWLLGGVMAEEGVGWIVIIGVGAFVGVIVCVGEGAGEIEADVCWVGPTRSRVVAYELP